MKTYRDLSNFIDKNKLTETEIRVAYRNSSMSPILYLNVFYYGNSLKFSDSIVKDNQRTINTCADFTEEVNNYYEKNKKGIMNLFIPDIRNEISLSLIKGRTTRTGFKVFDFKLENNELLLDVY